MPTNSDDPDHRSDDDSDERPRSLLSGAVGTFAAKTVVLLVLLALFLSYFLPDFDDVNHRIKERLSSERAKVFMLSFVQNPEALWISSEIYEREGKLDVAVRDMRLGLGLLEMHGADTQVRARYAARLDTLRAKLEHR